MSSSSGWSSARAPAAALLDGVGDVAGERKDLAGIGAEWLDDSPADHVGERRLDGPSFVLAEGDPEVLIRQSLERRQVALVELRQSGETFVVEDNEFVVHHVGESAAPQFSQCAVDMHGGDAKDAGQHFLRHA
jgi:hypothetical protein